MEKTDIKLHGTEGSLEIAVDSPQYKYYKEIELPVKVKVKEASSSYKNGVLEVVLPKAEASKPKGEPINRITSYNVCYTKLLRNCQCR